MTPEIKQRIEQIQQGETPDGFIKIKTDILPVDWKATPIANCIYEYTQKTTIPNQYPVLTSSRKGLMLQTEYFASRQVTTEDNTGYNILPFGYITFRSRSDDGRFRFNQNKIIEKGIISYFYPVFSFRETVSSEFMLELLNYSIYKRMYPYIEGTAQQVLSLNKLGQLVYYLPSLSEQKKIAAILTAQGKIIELKEKRLTEKKQQKKYLIQQLLTGRKRLPGFSEEWKATRLNNIVKRNTKRNIIRNTNVLTISAQYGLINQAEFFNKVVASDDKSNYFLLEKGDFAYNKSYSNGYPFGAIKRLTRYEVGIVSPLYICFQIKEGSVSGEYLDQYFEAGFMNHEIQAFAQEGARNHGLLNITVDDFFNSKILLPSLEEQTAIAEILSAADHEIDLLQQDIDQEKQMKKALTQLLLTGVVRVNL